MVWKCGKCAMISPFIKTLELLKREPDGRC